MGKHNFTKKKVNALLSVSTPNNEPIQCSAKVEPALYPNPKKHRHIIFFRTRRRIKRIMIVIKPNTDNQKRLSIIFNRGGIMLNKEQTSQSYQAGTKKDKSGKVAIKFKDGKHAGENSSMSAFESRGHIIKVIKMAILALIILFCSRFAFALDELAISAASASSSNSPYIAANAIDKNLSTYWRGSLTASWWLSLDLGKNCSLGQISIWWDKKYGSTNYNIQGSTDGATWTNLYTALSTAGATINPYQKDYTLSGTFRYIRLSINTAQWLYPIIYEVKLFGTSVDTTPPTGSIKINNDAQYAKTTAVTLNLSAQDNTGGSGLSQMQFSNDNSTWSTAEAYTTNKAWILSSGDGTKTVYVKYKDVAGNWSTVYSDTIILDTALPATTISTIDGLWHTSAVSIALAATDSGSGIDKTYYSTDGSNPTVVYSSTFSLSNDGIYSIKYYSTDKAGNAEAIKTCANQVKIDKTAPFGSITINANAQYTKSATVTLSLAATDSVSGLSQMQFSNDNSTWSTAESYAATKAWTLPSGDGTKTVYVKYKDVAGNWSSAYSDTIILDTTPPVISLNPVATPTNQNVILSYTVSDNLTSADKIIVSGDNSPYTSEGVHTVNLIAQDLSGNSASVGVSFTIDKTPPVVVITSPTNNAVLEDTPVQLQGTVDGVAFSESRALVSGDNTLNKSVTDAAGNTASASVSVYLYLGVAVGPNGGEVLSADGLVKVVIPSGALTQTQQIKVLTLSKETLQSLTPGGTSLLSVVECKPYGLLFTKPISIIYTLSQAEIPGTPVELGLYDSVQNKILYTGQSSTVPSDGYTLNFSIQHFSTYAALKGLTPQSTPIGSSVRIPLPDLLTGAFGHAIPITVAPGRKGMQPGVGLSYHSSSANSWIGLGFSLNPGFIVRSTRLGPPTYNDSTDAFYFITDAGTTELVHLIDNLYQAKVESSFTKFFKETDDTWRVVGKDGGTLRFGQDTNSKETSSAGTFAWYLTKATDTNGNYISFTYTKDQGKSYLSRIDYTGNDIGVAPTSSVEFILESRDDISSSYLSTARIATARRLKEVQVKVNSSLVWRYVLTYTYSPDTNRSLLTSIVQSGSDGKTLPAQNLSYQKAK